MFEITITDPGEKHRVGTEALRDLSQHLDQARRSGENAVLIVVEPDAWLTTPAAEGAAAEAHPVIARLQGSGVPIVVHLAGQITGAGLGLALACDVRYAAPGTRLGIGDPATSPGLGGGTTWLLRDRIGSALHDHLMWTGELLDAETAQGLRLVSGVGDRAEAEATARRLDALPRPVTSALRRSATAGLAPLLTERLEYDAWLARVAEKAS